MTFWGNESVSGNKCALALLCTTFWAAGGCMSTEPDTFVSFGHEIEITNLNGRHTFAKGAKIPLRDEAILVEADGRSPALLVPLRPGTFEAQLSPASRETPVCSLAEDTAKMISSRDEQALSPNAMVAEFVRLQVLVARRKTDEAMAGIATFRQAWPKANYIDVLELGVHVAAARLDDARRVLPALLARFPQDETLRALASRLSPKETP